MTASIDPDRLARARVLVVGDAMLDRYWFGAVDRISPEAPVPVVRVTREEERLGIGGIQRHGTRRAEGKQLLRGRQGGLFSQVRLQSRALLRWVGVQQGDGSQQIGRRAAPVE